MEIVNKNRNYYSEGSEREKCSEAVEHQTTVKPSAKALHHKTIFQFCYHHNSMMGAS
ncbi:MAG: hypothetical protein IMZ52_07190 [Actinobacteria bacterium]|nr:hypothetical protein [Actinomycetota bacterium]